MSIKKSLRFTILVFALIPFLQIACLTNLPITKRYNANNDQKINYQILTQDEIISNSGDNSDYDALLSKQHIQQLFSDHQNHKIDDQGSFTMSYHEHNYEYSYSFLNNSNQLLLVSKEIIALFNYKDTIFFVLLLFCTYIPCFLIMNHYYQTKFVQPIMHLRHVMRTAASGNLNIVSTLKSKDELGDLSRNLNKMLHIIKGNYDELSTMHEQLLENEDTLKNNYNRIEHLAYHDTLTDLPNRLAFLAFTNSILEKSNVLEDHHAIFFIDLDNFKMINDTLGHDYGDLLLVQTAQRLASILTDNDCIARAGGDEFMIMKPNLSSIQETSDLAEAILKKFNEPFMLNNETAYVSLSIGIAIYPESGLDTTTLTKNADIAMYHAKENGKNKFSIFDNNMEEKLNYKSLITDVLRYAINNNEIYLLYQPQISLKNNQI
ncbi:MAG: diguanylate cyclase, partial [Clostridiales bacterium]|nr:diguanylate cyclase [Clostridiales bacterium]